MKPLKGETYAGNGAKRDDWLLSRNDIDRSKILVAGWSLGGAVAIDLASRKHLAGLMTFNAFTTLRAMAHRLLSWLPTAHLISYRFDNLAKIR